MGTDLKLKDFYRGVSRSFTENKANSVKLRVPPCTPWFSFFKFMTFRQISPINCFGKNHKLLEAMAYNNIWGEYVS